MLNVLVTKDRADRLRMLAAGIGLLFLAAFFIREGIDHTRRTYDEIKYDYEFTGAAFQ
jgi:hypothetical protein